MNYDQLETKIGRRIKQERQRLGWTQEELAEKIGMKPLSISQYENNKVSPTAKTLYAMASVGINLPFIMMGAETIPDPELFSDNVYETVGSTVARVAEYAAQSGSPFSDALKAKITMLFFYKMALSTTVTDPSLNSLPSELVLAQCNG